MRCDEVDNRLVALHDDELSSSEAVQVREHLARCLACSGADRRLRRSLPTRPPGGPPAEIRARFEAALDPALLFALAGRPTPAPRATPVVSVWRAVTRAASVPMGAVVMYVVLLVGSFAWGVSNWWTLSSLREPTAIGAVAPSPTDGALGEPIVRPAIPADQFRPAAWDPGAEPDRR